MMGAPRIKRKKDTDRELSLVPDHGAFELLLESGENVQKKLHVESKNSRGSLGDLLKLLNMGLFIQGGRGATSRHWLGVIRSKNILLSNWVAVRTRRPAGNVW